jgi:hypothetical protein
MFRYSWIAVASGILWGCGGAATPAVAPEPARPAAAPVAVTDAGPNPPPAELAAYWPVAGEAPLFTARVALGKLSHSPLFGSIWPTIAPALDERYQACAKAFVDHGRDLLVRGTQERGYLVLLLDQQGLAALHASCAGSVLEASRAVAVNGASEAYQDGDVVLAISPPKAVLLGPRPEVEAALAAGGAKEPLPAHFTLQGNEIASLRADVKEPKITADARLAASPELFSLVARASLPGEELAQKVEVGFASFRGQAKERVKEAGGDATMMALLDGVTLQRSGNELRAALALRGSVDEQARALGQLVGMSVVAAQRYVLNAKAAEAKLALAQIVKAYQATLREAAAAKKPRKLASLPAVPATVPRGEKYQSKPEDWKAWAPIHFSIGEPQYFQYEVVAAKNGKSAQVIARGDLDGDGETSERRLTIELDPQTEQLTAKGLDETNPLE